MLSDMNTPKCFSKFFEQKTECCGCACAIECIYKAISHDPQKLTAQPASALAAVPMRESAGRANRGIGAQGSSYR